MLTEICQKTLRDLSEEIALLAIENGIKLKRFHTINVLGASDGVQKPFIADEMAAPPSQRRKKKVE
jgi:hypothetical protein